ncbi:MAG: YbaB/EbfC family nucleoid-associated protein [Bacilli bacterium]
MFTKEMVEKAQKQFKKINEVKEEINYSEFTSETSSKDVVITMFGSRIVKSVDIADKALEDKEILEDLIMISVNNCIKQIEKYTDERMEELVPSVKGYF